ncbi:branched-chain amino acid aminotransferase [Gulosibacter molinativorax]|uniref:branched-chain-amino-acid transaminase n=1 Tax=Gulosibacter molinativorax TaxID=256821 RepID=A0ABT7C9M7_9MICO|nr:branched-chain amino acid aminotransferase [Gulosibacter molinativorax]MDJ1371921.1 branched-chain amino acid aminotransferase [Gulosibacter molinativorax]QUY62570.1 Branched-chain amino acid aminotransferase [Gulosibacter molinativorax]
MTDGTSLEFTIEHNPNPASDEDRAKVLENPGFGERFTDHMVMIDWTRDGGWQNARVVPYGPLQMNPGNAIFHYAQEVFEGLKAYRHADGSVHTFRPEMNAKRMQRSAHRLALPELPVDVFVESLRQLVQADEAWVPAHGEGKSLYLRPFMIANEDFLGVRAAETVTYFVIASPAGAYFKDPTRPVNIWLETELSRAGRGGTGAAKCGGNYAASLLPQQTAYEHGCEQVLFLDSSTEQYLEELGGMNIVLVYRDGTVATPESDSILESVTNDSILTLFKETGHTVERRKITIDEWREGAESGAITEAFAVGTAAVISPIGTLKHTDFQIENPRVTEESLSMRMRAKLTGIQNGDLADDHGWLEQLA